jgi:hypothetical protein
VRPQRLRQQPPRFHLLLRGARLRLREVDRLLRKMPVCFRGPFLLLGHAAQDRAVRAFRLIAATISRRLLKDARCALPVCKSGPDPVGAMNRFWIAARRITEKEAAGSSKQPAAR